MVLVLSYLKKTISDRFRVGRSEDFFVSKLLIIIEWVNEVISSEVTGFGFLLKQPC